MEKINELYDKCSDERSQSAVHELIMGSGKTACIGPMLCMLLGKGVRAVVQIVPDPLLDQTRAVLQGIFSSVLIKRVFVISSFDDSNVDAMKELKKNLENAKRDGHIILCPPTQMKKLLLKFIQAVTGINELNPLPALPPRYLPQHVRPLVKNMTTQDISPTIDKIKVLGSILDIFRARDQTRPGQAGAVAIIGKSYNFVFANPSDYSSFLLFANLILSLITYFNRLNYKCLCPPHHRLIFFVWSSRVPHPHHSQTSVI